MAVPLPERSWSPTPPGAQPGAPCPPARSAAATASSPAADAARPHLGGQRPALDRGRSGSGAAGPVTAAATPGLRGARVRAPHPHGRPQEVHPHRPSLPRLGVGPARLRAAPPAPRAVLPPRERAPLRRARATIERSRARGGLERSSRERPLAESRLGLQGRGRTEGGGLGVWGPEFESWLSHSRDLERVSYHQLAL